MTCLKYQTDLAQGWDLAEWLTFSLCHASALQKSIQILSIFSVFPEAVHLNFWLHKLVRHGFCIDCLSVCINPLSTASWADVNMLVESMWWGLCCCSKGYLFQRIFPVTDHSQLLFCEDLSQPESCPTSRSLRNTLICLGVCVHTGKKKKKKTNCMI